MILEILSSIPTGTLASELLERTSSTPKVQQIVQLSLAPAFLLSGIGAIMNVMMSRLVWIAGRIERIDRRLEEDLVKKDRIESEVRELHWLHRRRRLAQRAVVFSTAAAAIISIVIGLLFVSAYVHTQLGTVTAIAWIVTMLTLVTGLIFFLLETRLAARGAQAMELREIAAALPRFTTERDKKRH